MGDLLLACDWGTTRLRAWVLSGDGSVARAASFDLGVGRLKPGEAAERFEREIRPRLQATGLPAILCGMVGSELGWSPTPHLACPATLDDARAAVREVSPGVRIVPGLRCAGLAGTPDVMRGEETQVFGWLEQAPERRRGRHLICHPGTHSKWILVEDGAVVRFATAMTGELFDLLRRHSVLRNEAEPTDGAAFAEGLEVGRSGLLLSAALFTVRGRRALGELSAAQASSYLSGVLIGAEVAAMPGRLWPEAERIVLIGAPPLTGPYAQAMQALGREVATHDGDAAARVGLLALASTPGPRPFRKED
jgi:2-dehydro-3-deoxygalactonokinase